MISKNYCLNMKINFTTYNFSYCVTSNTLHDILHSLNINTYFIYDTEYIIMHTYKFINNVLTLSYGKFN